MPSEIKIYSDIVVFDIVVRLEADNRELLQTALTLFHLPMNHFRSASRRMFASL